MSWKDWLYTNAKDCGIYLLLLTGFIVFYCYLPLINEIKEELPVMKVENKLDQKKLIVIYTTAYGDKYWLAMSHLNYSEHCGCNFSGCGFTYEKQFLPQADVAIFHARDMPSIPELIKLNKKRKPGQLWLYYIMENPYNAPRVEPIERFFNLAASYRLDSDVRKVYRTHIRKKKEGINFDVTKNINYAENKTGQIAWLVSHCGTLRDALIPKLESYGLKVEVGGACANRFRNKLNCERSICYKELNRFKFYFSAENNLCEDYITEKYWNNPVDHNAIPIVLGGANYSNPKLAIPGSFIDALQFKTVKDLAEHIKQVDKDDVLFNSYFKWKPYWTFYDKLYQGDCDPFMCDICQKIQTNIVQREHPLSYSIQRDTECIDKENHYRKWVQT